VRGRKYHRPREKIKKPHQAGNTTKKGSFRTLKTTGVHRGGGDLFLAEERGRRGHLKGEETFKKLLGERQREAIKESHGVGGERKKSRLSPRKKKDKWQKT